MNYYQKTVYDAIYRLDTQGKDSPDIVDTELDAVMKDLRSTMRKNTKVLDDAVAEAKKGVKRMSVEMLMKNDSYIETYFDWIIGREFDLLRKWKFQSIVLEDGAYKFKIVRYNDNYMKEREESAHLARLNSLVKMHLHNMPIYDIKYNPKTGEPT